MVCAFLTRDQGRTFKIGLVTLKGHSIWLSPTLSDLLTTINVSEPNRSVTTLHADSRGKCSLFITDTEDIRPGAAVHVRLGELSLISSDSTLPTFRGCTLSRFTTALSHLLPSFLHALFSDFCAFLQELIFLSSFFLSALANLFATSPTDNEAFCIKTFAIENLALSLKPLSLLSALRQHPEPLLYLDLETLPRG